MFKKNKYFILVLCFIFLIALLLRIYKLAEFPVGFHIDEASLGYNGYSLLLTGKDENNNKLPLYIDMFGDNRPSGYHYLTILPIAVFGLTEFATRLPAAFFGALTIFPKFFFTYVLFKKKEIAVFAGILIAIAPWQIILSRASGEAIVSLFFIITGFALILSFIDKKRNLYLILGTVSLISSFFFYHTPRVFVPMLFMALVFFLRNKFINNRIKLMQLFISFIFVGLIAIVLVFMVAGGTGRFTQVNIFGHPETKLVMNEQIQEDGLDKTSLVGTRVFHNKIINYSLTFAANYLDYFNGNFLFIKGGLPIWYFVPSAGLIYLALLPLVLLGIVHLWKDESINSKIPLIWLFIAPVTAAITVDDIPNINRAIVMFPMLEIAAAYGFYKIIYNKTKKIKIFICLFFGLILLFNSTYFLHQYFVHSYRHRTWYRNNGFKEMMTIVNKNYNKYQKVIITKASGGIYPLVLFYAKYDPINYQKEGSPKGRDYRGFGKFIFVPQGCPSKDRDNRISYDQKILYVNTGECENIKNVKFQDIYKEDGTRAFRLQL